MTRLVFSRRVKLQNQIQHRRRHEVQTLRRLLALLAARAGAGHLLVGARLVRKDELRRTPCIAATRDMLATSKVRTPLCSPVSGSMSS